MRAAGHDASEQTLILCEGLLRYLPELWFRDLLRVCAHVAAHGSVLAASISTRRPDADEGARAARVAHEEALAESGEPVLTVPEREVALTWLAEGGWSVESVVDTADAMPGEPPGRLLVTARR
jgi:O-methyltransferase involved in polyketide biosynthesis